MRLSRRTKIISIRVSPEEYDQLQTLCVRDGMDNISDVARKGMKMLMRQENEQPAIESRVQDIDTRMSFLDQEVSRLASLLGVARMGELERQ